jgi:hypothetical protein
MGCHGGLPREKECASKIRLNGRVQNRTPAVSARTELKPAKASLYQPEGRNYASGYRLVVLRCLAPRGVFGNLMIVFGGRGFSPRRISIRKHDRPIAIEKSSTASKMFLVIQF